jgi:hypothetical protein
MAIRSDAAIKRIETRMTQLGVQAEPIPRANRDREMLRCNQLERIAAMTEAVFTQTDPRLDAAIALVSSGNWTKAELEAILLPTMPVTQSEAESITPARWKAKDNE